MGTGSYSNRCYSESSLTLTRRRTCLQSARLGVWQIGGNSLSNVTTVCIIGLVVGIALVGTGTASIFQYAKLEEKYTFYTMLFLGLRQSTYINEIKAYNITGNNDITLQCIKHLRVSGMQQQLLATARTER